MWLKRLTSPWKMSRAKTGRNVSSGSPRNVVSAARIVSAMIAGSPFA